MAGLRTRASLAFKAAIGQFSEDSAKQAFGMLSGIMPGGLGAPPSKGTAEFLRAYSEMPWLRAVSERVATAVASTEWQLFVRGRGGEKARRDRTIQRALDPIRRRKLLQEAKDEEDLKPIEDHPFLDVLHSANSFQTGESMRKVTQLHLDLVGEAFWLKERDGFGMVTSVWPVPPNWVVNTPTPTNPFYRVQFRGWRGMIPDTEVLWFSNPNPVNPYSRGTGTASSLGDELETDEYAAKHTKAFFYNRARPDMLVWPKTGQMRPEAVARLEEDWLSRSQGFWKAFKPYFLSREVGVQMIDQNFRSLQLVQLREYERNTIIQVFGIPPELLGVIENSNRATINAADYLFSRYVIQPRLEFIRSTLQERLAPEYDERLIVDYVSPVQDDKEMQLQAATVMPASINVDEWRRMQGLPPLEKDLGKVHIFSGTQKEHEMGEEPEPVVLPFGVPGGGPPGAPKPPGVEDEDEDEKTILGLTKTADVDLPGPSKVAAALERGLVAALVAAWDTNARNVNVDTLASALDRGDEQAVVVQLMAVEDRGVEQALMTSLTTGFMRGAAHGAEPLRAAGIQVRDQSSVLDLENVHPAAVAWARQHAAQFVVASERVRSRVRRLVAQAIEEGVAPRDLARQLRDVVGLTEQQADAVVAFRRRLREAGVAPETLSARVLRYGQAQRRLRAETIARTELIGAVNQGQQELWREATRRGLLNEARVRRVWIATDDELLEERCEALNGQTTGLNEPFSGGVMVPPLHPRCRCAVGLVRT